MDGPNICSSDDPYRDPSLAQLENTPSAVGSLSLDLFFRMYCKIAIGRHTHPLSCMLAPRDLYVISLLSKDYNELVRPALTVMKMRRKKYLPIIMRKLLATKFKEHRYRNHYVIIRRYENLPAAHVINGLIGSPLIGPHIFREDKVHPGARFFIKFLLLWYDTPAAENVTTGVHIITVAPLPAPQCTARIAPGSYFVAGDRHVTGIVCNMPIDDEEPIPELFIQRSDGAVPTHTVMSVAADFGDPNMSFDDGIQHLLDNGYVMATTSRPPG